MTASLLAFLVISLAYLVGAVPFGYLVARSQGVDILREGSGNIGATNVGRVLGRRFGILVFLLDFAKGALPALVADHIAKRDEAIVALLGRDGLPVLAGLAAFLGHLFPVWLRFRGGKGVATAAGVVAVLVPIPTVAALIAWTGVVLLSGYVSLASLSAAGVLCAVRLANSARFNDDQITLSLFCLLAAGLVFVRHRGNIVRLWHGNENRLRGIPTMTGFVRTLHVMSVGLLFGSAMFFMLTAGLLFEKFKALGADPSAAERAWLPEFDRDMGARLAGVAVSPLFPTFFLVKGISGFVAVITALIVRRSLSAQRLQRARVLVALLALITVVAGWPVVEKVSALRFARYQADQELAQAASAAFGTWHAISIILALATLVLVTVLMALAAHLPGEEEQSVPPPPS